MLFPRESVIFRFGQLECVLKFYGYRNQQMQGATYRREACCIHLRKRSKKLLWLALEKLNEKGKDCVNELLALHPDLAEAYRLKNALHQWFYTSISSNVKEKLYEWFNTVKNRRIKAFDSVVKTFKNWQTEILNAFVYPYNNGYIEGVNNTTKVIKRMSYGIRSFDRLRKKILFRQAIRLAI